VDSALHAIVAMSHPPRLQTAVSWRWRRRAWFRSPFRTPTDEKTARAPAEGLLLRRSAPGRARSPRASTRRLRAAAHTAAGDERDRIGRRAPGCGCAVDI